ncbi:hypothetical protein DIU36_05085 [Mucilaginibacter rubeus]|nr:hypothetical protein DIU36_05085 [Mucilaginibacter rubeus]
MQCRQSFFGTGPPGNFDFKFSIMAKKSNKPTTLTDAHLLKTDFPICEKDEQAQCMERMRKLQAEALKLWRALKKKCK